MTNHFVPTIVASFAAILVGGITTTVAVKSLKPPTQYVQVKPSEMPPKAATAKLDKYRWQGLEQSEIDALTAELVARKLKLDVRITCIDDNRCGDLALDFDNAIESAKQKSYIERPFIDDTRGVGSTSKDLVEIITKTTRLKPKLLALQRPADDGKVILAIGVKE